MDKIKSKFQDPVFVTLFLIYGLLFIFFYRTYFFLIVAGLGDLKVHTVILQHSLMDKELPANFGFYLTLWCFSLFDFGLFYVGSSIILSLATIYKIYISWDFIHQKFKEKNIIITPKIKFALGIVSILFLFLHPLLINFDYKNKMYLGKIAINIWHNSTLIFLMPFILLLYIQAIYYIENPYAKRLRNIIVLCLLNICIKPSFFFVFAIGFPLIMFIKYRLKKSTIYSFLAVLSCSVLVLLQFYFIYVHHQKVDRFLYDGQASKVVLGTPFEVWNLFTTNIPQDLLLSICLPLFYTVFFFKEIKSKINLLFAWMLFVIAILIFIFISESGPRLTHGNFIWQAFACNYLLHLVVIQDFSLNFVLNKNSVSLKNGLMLSGLLYSVFSGIAYFMKVMWFQDIQ
jgi:hypothetical protein